MSSLSHNQVEDIDLSKNMLFLRMMPRIDYNRKRGSLRSVSAGEGERKGREGRTRRTCVVELVVQSGLWVVSVMHS